MLVKYFKQFNKNIFIIATAVISAALLSVFLTGVLQLHRGGQQIEPYDLEASILPAKLPLTQNVIFAMAQNNPDYFPIRDWNIGEPDIFAKSALVIIPGKRKILFKKNIDEKLSIASLTKIMTAVVLLDEAGPGDEAMIKYSHVMAEGEAGNLVIGERLVLSDLLKIMLITSSNDAAEAIAETVGEKLQGTDDLLKSPQTFFVEAMNKKAVGWGLASTHFSNPTGLVDQDNFSTAKDLAVLAEKIIEQYPAIWKISATPIFEVRDTTGWINHRLINTNQLLSVFDDIIGSKTGYTEEAGECMIVIQKNPAGDEDIIYILLGSNNKFTNMKILINWVNEAFLW